MKTCGDIIIEIIKSNGLDGLANGEYQCGCGLDDLRPCDFGGGWECKPAKKVLVSDLPKEDQRVWFDEYGDDIEHVFIATDKELNK